MPLRLNSHYPVFSFGIQHTCLGVTGSIVNQDMSSIQPVVSSLHSPDGDDREGVQELYLAAFPEEERDVVARLADNLIMEGEGIISLVARQESGIVGHVSFSPVDLGGSEDEGYILAPLAVRPECQKQGIGTRLVEVGLEQMREAGIAIVFVYGDPAYYSRFGFSAELAAGHHPPYELQFPFGWQVLHLREVEAFEGEVAVSCVEALSDPAMW